VCSGAVAYPFYHLLKYLSFHLNWVLVPFVHGRLQNLKTSEVTFAHVITLLIGITIRTNQSDPVSHWVYVVCERYSTMALSDTLQSCWLLPTEKTP